MELAEKEVTARTVPNKEDFKMRNGVFHAMIIKISLFALWSWFSRWITCQ